MKVIKCILVTLMFLFELPSISSDEEMPKVTCPFDILKSIVGGMSPSTVNWRETTFIEIFNRCMSIDCFACRILFTFRFNSSATDTARNTYNVEVIGCNGTTLDASSMYQNKWEYRADRGQLNNVRDGGGAGGWLPLISDKEPWIQADLDQKREVIGVVTQGYFDYSAWVTSFCVSYSEDGNNFTNATNINGSNVFDGNWDQDTRVPNLFKTVVMARIVRINPKESKSGVSVRFALLGVDLTTVAATDKTTVENTPSVDLTVAATDKTTVKTTPLDLTTVAATDKTTVENTPSDTRTILIVVGVSVSLSVICLILTAVTCGILHQRRRSYFDASITPTKPYGNKIARNPMNSTISSLNSDDFMRPCVATWNKGLIFYNNRHVDSDN